MIKIGLFSAAKRKLVQLTDDFINVIADIFTIVHIGKLQMQKVAEAENSILMESVVGMAIHGLIGPNSEEPEVVRKLRVTTSEAIERRICKYEILMEKRLIMGENNKKILKHKRKNYREYRESRESTMEGHKLYKKQIKILRKRVDYCEFRAMCFAFEIDYLKKIKQYAGDGNKTLDDTIEILKAEKDFYSYIMALTKNYSKRVDIQKYESINNYRSNGKEVSVMNVN